MSVPLPLCPTTSGSSVQVKSTRCGPVRRCCNVLETVRNDLRLLGSLRDTLPLVSSSNDKPAELLGPWPVPVGFLSSALQPMEHACAVPDVLAPRMRLHLSAHCIASYRVMSHCVHQWSNRWLTKVVLTRYSSSIDEGNARWLRGRSASTTRRKSWWKQVTEWEAG